MRWKYITAVKLWESIETGENVDKSWQNRSQVYRILKSHNYSYKGKKGQPRRWIKKADQP